MGLLPISLCQPNQSAYHSASPLLPSDQPLRSCWAAAIHPAASAVAATILAINHFANRSALDVLDRLETHQSWIPDGQAIYSELLAHNGLMIFQLIIRVVGGLLK